MHFSQLVFRNAARSPLRLVMTVVAVAILVTAFIFPNALVEGERRYRALRSLWARRATTWATGGGIALLVFVLSAAGMLANGMRQTLVSAGQPNRALVMQHDSWNELSSRIDSSALSRVNAAPGIARRCRSAESTSAATMCGPR